MSYIGIILPVFELEIFSRDQLNICVRWMTRFAEALAQEGLRPMKRLPGKVGLGCLRKMRNEITGH